jgi:hypothetical protein
VEAKDIERVKVGVAVAVATTIFLEVERMKPGKNRDIRVRIAADAIDRTAPFPMFYELYAQKPADEADPFFLMRHLDYLNMLDARHWPKQKVRAQDRGEYTRVVRGLDAFLIKGFTDTPYTAQEKGDVAALLTRIHKAHPWLPEAYLPVLREHLMETGKVPL